MQPTNPIQEPPWTKEATLSLIDLYRRNESLWNRKHPHYLYHFTRTQTMSNIYKALDGVYSLKRIHRKLKNLRCKLNREVQTVIQKRKLGQRYSSPWALFNTLLFMTSKKIPELPQKTTDQAENIISKLRCRRCTKQNPTPKTGLHCNLVNVKSEDLDEFIEVKTEVVESLEFYPVLQVDTDSSLEADSSQSREATVATHEPLLKRIKEEPEDDIKIEASSSLCATADVFVSETMGDDIEDGKQTFGSLVDSKLEIIQSEKLRKKLKETIAATIEAFIKEDEKQFSGEPETDPLS